MKCHNNQMKNMIPRILLLSFVTYFGISIQLCPVNDLNVASIDNCIVNILGSFQGFSYKSVIILSGLFGFYYFVYMQEEMEKEIRARSVIIPAILYSMFIVFGEAFTFDNTWQLAISLNNGQIIKGLIVFFAYLVFLIHAIALLFVNISKTIKNETANHGKKNNKNTWLLSNEKKAFIILFISLLVLYLPYMAISYPAIIMGDTFSQITQAFSELKMPMGYMTHQQLLSENVFINQHHPVLHTLLIHWCLLGGDSLFHSFNIGLFFYSIIQLFIFIGSVSYALVVIIKETKLSYRAIVIIILYYYLHPLVHNYMFLVTKDIIYSAFLLIFFIQLFRIVKDKQNFTIYLILYISGLGMLLFRNDSKYVLIISSIIVALISKKRNMLIYSGSIIITSFLVFQVLFPSLYFTPGSKREMLSIPFQQTARYVLYHEDKITYEEKTAINAVLDYSSLAIKYDPDKSDNIKATFKETATSQDLKNYFSAWLRMFFKHPGTYIQATLNNYYQYFYPGKVKMMRFTYKWSEGCMETINNAIKPLGRHLSYPNWTEATRMFIDRNSSILNVFPIFSFLMSPAVYSWIIILLIAYSLRIKNKKNLSLLIVPLILLLICFAGPCNGSYGRYTYPIIVLLPFVTVIYRDLLLQK